MTIELEVFCLKKPDTTLIGRILNAEKTTWTEKESDDDTLRYVWYPTQKAAVVRFSRKPLILRDFMDATIVQETIDDINATGVVIPDYFQQVFEKDDVVTYAIADHKLADAITYCPALLKMNVFNRAFGVVQHSKGEQTYQVEISLNTLSDRVTISKTLDFCLLLANTYDGVIYDDVTDRCGKPNIEKRMKELNFSAEGMRNFMFTDSPARRRLLADIENDNEHYIETKAEPPKSISSYLM